ncbi:SflA family class IV lanthipeptide [Kitasatospora purpeofusca]
MSHTAAGRTLRPGTAPSRCTPVACLADPWVTCVPTRFECGSGS